MNEFIIFVESAGTAWWGGLIVLAVAAIALLVFDRPHLRVAGRGVQREKQRKVA